jgi:excisionase family DNA binding protein
VKEATKAEIMRLAVEAVARIDRAAAIRPGEWIKVKEACRILGCEKSSVYNMVAAGKVRSKRSPTNRILIYAADLLRDPE